MDEFLKEYPFRCSLSLKPLIDYLINSTEFSNDSMSFFMDDLKDMIKQVPELFEPIEDITVLERHSDQVQKLMSLVFPPASWNSEALAAVIPFSMKPFFVSPHFQRLFLNNDGSFRGRRNVDEESFNKGRAIRAYLFFLDRFYDIHHNFDYPLVHIVPDPSTGLDRYFKIKFDFRFVEAHTIKEPKTLSDKERALIEKHLIDPEFLREVLPAEDFELRGFTVFQAVDVTESEIMSALERDLIEEGYIVSQEGFPRLEQRLQTLFRRPQLRAGLDAIQEDQVLQLSLSGCETPRCCIYSDSRHIPLSEFEGTVYEKAMQNKEILWVSDILEECCGSRDLEEELLKMGSRSLLIAPLYDGDKCIGVLHLGSPQPRDLGPMDALLMSHIQPLFSMTVKKALDDLDNRIQGVIKEKCTAIHPTVEWRFRKAAFQYLENLRMGQTSELESIVFKDVYPLYGVSDICGSAIERNRAIQNDLSEHLNLALEIVLTANEANPMLILQELAGRMRGYLERIKTGLGIEGELSVIKFLRDEVEAVFSHLRGFSLKVSRAIDVYKSVIDPNVGTVYSLRKEFEESISILNDRLTTFLDQEEAEAQAIFPHYFERHRTDGVDYLIYMGGSLLEDGGFNELSLKNLRLWQIKLACGMAWHTEQLKSSLKTTLDVTHLILVQDAPLSIRFRFDEKRFDVDGAYDIRQEIIKSRLDKATVKGKKERLTQPGKIALVYSRPEEEQEIRRHVDFLLSQGYLTGEVEEVELDQLPGVQGLRSLRIGVNLDSRILSEGVKLGA